MKRHIGFWVGILLFGSFVFPAQAAFTSFYIFGDGISTTTNGPGGSSYYGERYSNGRVWVEVLAQRQGLAYDSNNNWSYFGDYSSDLVTNVNNFPAPPDANTALFVVWVNNADFVYDMDNYSAYASNNIATWTNAINQSLANHWQALTNLYAKGARTLIMPNAVEITEIPQYSGLSATEKSFVRQRVIDFNTAFATLLNQARTFLPDITIYEPDFFSLLDNILTNAAAYGLTNALASGVNGPHTVGALGDPLLTDWSLNGPGAIYIFWDYWHPTAKAHAVMADVLQQLISPVQISKIKVFNGSNRLDVVNMPVGLNGFVDGSTNLSSGNWTTNASFSGTNTTQSMFVLTTNLSQNSLRFSPMDGPPLPGDGGGPTNAVVADSTLQVYRLRFPFAWTWP